MSEADKAYDRALSFLEKRDRTEHEIADRLSGSGFSEPSVIEALDRLREAGFVNDENYAARFLDSLAAKGRGRLRIAAEMRRKGLPDELVRNTLEDRNTPEDELSRAMDAARRALAQIPAGTDSRKAAAKVNRRLVSLGYTYDVIGSVVSELMRESGDAGDDDV